ncbi:MAG: PQQ-binding-like beta-propeller repeat protein [Gemmataceae bacterium]|nr:PQQ-binding-like beta-propeller repeat protein [Gemmataceae bacterium]
MKRLLPMLALLAAVRAQPPAAVLPGESKPAAARLADARALADPAKAAEALADLSANGTDLVPVSPTRSVRLRDLAQEAIAALPPAGLEAYRRLAETQARKWLDEGNALRAADEAFATRAGLAALDRLGDEAFLDGRFDEAEQWYRRISPLEGKGGHPDPTEAQAARARAKQVLARLHAGRAEAGLEAFRHRHPKASGNLAGQEGLYADILAKVAAAPPALGKAKGWPAFGGGPTRGRLAEASPKLPADLGRLCRGGPSWRFSLETRKPRAADLVPEKAAPVEVARRMAFHPVLAGTTALVSDGRRVTAYDLKAGTSKDWFDLSDFLAGTRGPAPLPGPHDLRHTLAVADGHVYARLGTSTVRDVQPRKEKAEDRESVLVCLSLEPDRDGSRRRWMARALEPGRKDYSVFEGAPLVAGGRAYIAATRFDGDRMVTSIRCYPARAAEGVGEPTHSPLWRTDVCETRELRSGEEGGKRWRHHLLTLAAGKVVYCSHSGAIVAVDARTGQRSWAVRYPRRDAREPADDPLLRDLAPCLFAEGRLYAAPSDSDRMLCLDPATGETVWERDSLDAVHLLGVGKGRLIFTSWRNPAQGRLVTGSLRAVNAADGSDEGGWMLPDDEGGWTPVGRGLLAGGFVLWPTARLDERRDGKPVLAERVFVVRQEDGRQADDPSLVRLPAGNLAYADGVLLLADQQTLRAYVPDEDETPARER